jgi:predicted Zn-dependent peptidase
MKTAMGLALSRLEMLYGKMPDDIHWEMFKNDCMEKEREHIVDFAYGCVQHISREDIEQYYNKIFNQMPKL